MALVSAFSAIRALSLFHITLAFYLLTNPRMIAEQNLVVILGEAMDLVMNMLYLLLLQASNIFH
jgi:hypothetical protein